MMLQLVGDARTRFATITRSRLGGPERLRCGRDDGALRQTWHQAAQAGTSSAGIPAEIASVWASLMGTRAPDRCDRSLLLRGAAGLAALAHKALQAETQSIGGLG